MTDGDPTGPGAELSTSDLAVDHRLSLLAQSFRFLLDITPVDGEVGGAQLRSVGFAHRSSSSSSYSPGSAAARPSCAHRNRSACSSPVHSSMKVFLNSSASTQPTRG